MSDMYVSNKNESIRLFKNPILDALSYVHWSMPLIFWLPIVGYFLYRAVVAGDALYLVVLAVLGGVVFWSLSEYLLHRFVFHYEPSSGWGQRIHFLIHGVHHDYPNDSKRLVMPPPLAVLLAIPFLVFLEPMMVYFILFVLGFVFGSLFNVLLNCSIYNRCSQCWTSQSLIS